ncbi:FixH family protein [Nonomuraea sp. NPDC049309]|uniref:FixH family protein n=1 Tax=Nonomuraea sp. NPDC049309 TaxID=3364350 RepID=UPI0037183B1C
MRRVLIAAGLVAVAVTIFVVGRSASAEPVRVTSTGARYAATVLIGDPTPGPGTVEVVVDRGDADTVNVSAVMPDMGHAMPELTATEREPGRFIAEGELFSMAGAWEVTVHLDGPSGPEDLTVKALITQE